MDPLTLIVSTLAAGAAAAGKDVATQAVKDGYAAFKSLVLRKLGSKDAETSIQQLQHKPDSESRQAVVKENLTEAHLAQDAEVVRQAQSLLELLKAQGQLSPTFQAKLEGSGAIAQGQRAVAAGERGIAIGGNVQGNVRTGDQQAESLKDTTDQS